MKRAAVFIDDKVGEFSLNADIALIENCLKNAVVPLFRRKRRGYFKVFGRNEERMLLVIRLVVLVFFYGSVRNKQQRPAQHLGVAPLVVDPLNRFFAPVLPFRNQILNQRARNKQQQRQNDDCNSLKRNGFHKTSFQSVNCYNVINLFRIIIQCINGLLLLNRFRMYPHRVNGRRLLLNRFWGDLHRINRRILLNLRHYTQFFFIYKISVYALRGVVEPHARHRERKKHNREHYQHGHYIPHSSPLDFSALFDGAAFMFLQYVFPLYRQSSDLNGLSPQPSFTS